MTITISPIGVLIFLTLISITLNAYFIHRANYLIKYPFGQVADVRYNEPQPTDSIDSDEVYSQRHEEFDNRIMAIKEQLAMQQQTRERETTVAEETHPNVKNLPHNTINANRVPDVEYAD